MPTVNQKELSVIKYFKKKIKEKKSRSALGQH